MLFLHNLPLLQVFIGLSKKKSSLNLDKEMFDDD